MDNYNKVYEIGDYKIQTRTYSTHGYKETQKPEKLYHEEQKDHRNED